VPERSKSAKQALREYLEQEHPAVITEAIWLDLRMRLAPVSDSYLRDLLRATALPFEQPYAGVRQHTLEELEASLCELERVYTEAQSANDRERARYARRQVIAAKDRAKFLAANPRTPEDKRALKQEMVEWMLVWLDNPEVFPAWVKARKRSIPEESQ
jgi:hypothetical protein